jgi:hypothetical protein
MAFASHYRAAQELSPRAARLARRLLENTAGIPVEWRLPLTMALIERAVGAAQLTPSDFSLLARGRREFEGASAPTQESADQSAAWGFVATLRQASQQERGAR